MEQTQTKFEGWAILELMGHRKEIGFVTTEYYGAVGLFRVDTPELPEREYVLTRPQWAGDRYAPVGSTVKRSMVVGRTCLVGPGSIYALNPCTEEAARAAIESSYSRPLILLSVPEGREITAGDIADEQDPAVCTECGNAEQYCECLPI